MKSKKVENYYVASALLELTTVEIPKHKTIIVSLYRSFSKFNVFIDRFADLLDILFQFMNLSLWVILI